jgi:hypothetical protein
MSDSETPVKDALPPVEATLQWEADHRRWASAGGVVAGLALLVGLVIQAAVQAGGPQVTLLHAFRSALTINGADLRVPVYQYLSDHAAVLLISYLLQATAYGAAMLAVGYLARATAARNANLRAWVIPIALIGLGLLGIATAVTGIGLITKAHSFVTGSDHSHHAANAVIGHNPIIQGGAALQFIGTLLFAVGTVMVSLNAMRCGLLTRFMGILGIIAGVLYVFPTAVHAFPFVFWLVFLGVLIGGHWPNGVPPAWASGRSEPWPSSQEVRQQREDVRRERQAARRRAKGEPEPEPEPDPTPVDSVPAGAQTRAPHPSSKKRKRKRR